VRVVADSHAIFWYLRRSPSLSGTAADTLRASEEIVISVATLVDLWYVTQTTEAITADELARVRSTLEVGIGVENLDSRHALVEHPRHSLCGDPQPADARNAAHLVGFDGDAVEGHGLRHSRYAAVLSAWQSYPCDMASISLDGKLAARLAERAKRAGVSVDELAEKAIEDYLGEQSGPSASDPFAFFGVGSNPAVQAEDADRLLAEGFGR